MAQRESEMPGAYGQLQLQIDPDSVRLQADRWVHPCFPSCWDLWQLCRCFCWLWQICGDPCRFAGIATVGPLLPSEIGKFSFWNVLAPPPSMYSFGFVASTVPGPFPKALTMFERTCEIRTSIHFRSFFGEVWHVQV